jgi:uncharacterized repeat protein (TIGR03803 family)
MHSKKPCLRVTAMLWITALTLIGARATGQTQSLLYSFNISNGIFPQAGLVFDKAGNLYGTTVAGGAYRGGTVFELTPQAGGGWAEIVLHNFDTVEGSAGGPTTSLILDASGNLYGTALGGPFGQGIVFELSPQDGGAWAYKRLHAFGNGKDGQTPSGGLVVDATGNLYGMTAGGGAYGGGIVFKLSPSASGIWTEKILHHFNRAYPAGYAPYGSLLFDLSGNLYGTTAEGGSCTILSSVGCGTAFKLTHQANGTWTYATIHEFGHRKKGTLRPLAGLTSDAAGNLYGTTTIGGTGACDSGCGTVFELIPMTAGGWVEKILYSFSNTPDGSTPQAPVILDGSGNVYGTTLYGGPFGLGAAFELTPLAGGVWQERILQPLASPYGGLVFDGSGNLYGTTNRGGNGLGTVFEITP